MSKKVTVMNAYTWFNKGDAGILVGTLHEVNRVLQDEELEIRILSFTPEEDYKHYKEIDNVKAVYSNLLNPYPFRKTKVGKAFAVGKLAFHCALQLVLFFLFRAFALKVYPALKVMKESDVVIVCGGGFLGGNKFNSLIHLHQIFLATFLQKKVVLWGASIEPPTHKLIKRITETVIKRLGHVFSREAITTTYLGTFLPEEQYSVTPDLAFMVPAKSSKQVETIAQSLPKNRLCIGLTVRHWHFPKSKDKAAALDTYKKSIAHMLVEFTERKSVTFVFIPQVIFDGDDDRIIAREIREGLPEHLKRHFVILENDLSPQEIKELISRLYLFVGTRMHSNIFATGALVPTVAIAYEAKTNGIMKMLGLEPYVMNIEEITPDSLIKKVYACLEFRGRIHEHLARKIPEVQAAIRLKSVFLEAYGHEHHDSVFKRADSFSA